MRPAFGSIEPARQEIMCLRNEFQQLERRVDCLRESLRKSLAELFGQDRQAFTAFDEELFAVRIAEALASRILVPQPTHSNSTHYVREKEAAEYMGIKVSTLRAWRMRRSKHGPPFSCIGRMVMYPIAELEEHMRAGMVPRRV